MKRIRLCVAFILACSAVQLSALSLTAPSVSLPKVKAPKGALPLTIDTFSGAYYDAYTLPDNFLAILSALFNLRAGINVDFESRLGKIGGFGGEVGANYMLVEDDNGDLILNLIDLPFRLKLSLTLGKAFKLEAFGGVLFAMAVTPYAILNNPYLDAGGRMALGPIFLEGSYEFSFGPEYESFPRFGLGLSLPISS